jgi:hypothetical protein
MTPSVSVPPRTATALLFGPDEDKPAAIAQRLRSADMGGDIRGALDRLPPLTREAAVGQVSSATPRGGQEPTRCDRMAYPVVSKAPGGRPLLTRST